MAARNPTDFNTWNDESSCYTGSQIITTAPSAFIDDQVFCLDAGELVFFNQFPPIDITTTGAFPTASNPLRTWHFDSKDMCDDPGVSNNEFTHTIYILGWVTAATVDGEVKITGTAVASNTVTIGFDVSNTTRKWYSGTMNCKTNGVEETLTMDARISAGGGAGFVRVAAIAVFANET